MGKRIESGLAARFGGAKNVVLSHFSDRKLAGSVQASFWSSAGKTLSRKLGNGVEPSWHGFRGGALPSVSLPGFHLGNGTQGKVNESTALLTRPGPKCRTVGGLCGKALVFGRARGQNANDSITLFELALPKPSTVLHFWRPNQKCSIVVGFGHVWRAPKPKV